MKYAKTTCTVRRCNKHGSEQNLTGKTLREDQSVNLNLLPVYSVADFNKTSPLHVVLCTSFDTASICESVFFVFHPSQLQQVSVRVTFLVVR